MTARWGDSQLHHFPALTHVGARAKSALKRCCGADESTAPLDLSPQLPPELVQAALGERGWTVYDTEHVFCENRRYDSSKKLQRPRATGAQRARPYGPIAWPRFGDS